MIAVLTSRAGWDVLRRHVFARDEYKCMAPVLDEAERSEDCRSRWADEIRRGFAGVYDPEALTLDHVHWHVGGTKGKKAPDDEAHLVTLCFHHHLFGWATSRRGRFLERAYLKRLYGGHDATETR